MRQRPKFQRFVLPTETPDAPVNPSKIAAPTRGNGPPLKSRLCLIFIDNETQSCFKTVKRVFAPNPLSACNPLH
jgi:hypothetical protein